MKPSRLAAVFLAVITLAGALLACGQLGLSTPTSAPAWTPAAVTGAPIGSSQGDVAPTEQATEQSAPLVEASPNAASEPAAPPTLDPHHVIITESDIASAVGSGAASDSDIQVDGLAVHFTGGKTVITAANVTYGFVNVQDLKVTGRLVARDGALQMDVESVQPQGIVAAVIPGIINQALRQYTGRWYVEDVHTGEGQVELTIR